MDGLLGNRIAAVGEVTLSAFNFFEFEGRVAFRTVTESVRLSDGSNIAADVHDWRCDGRFAGVAGVGLNLTGADFAIAVITDLRRCCGRGSHSGPADPWRWSECKAHNWR